MPVRVIEANHALSPAVLLDRVHKRNMEGLQTFRELIEVVFLKVDFAIVPAKNDLLRFNERNPGIKRLQAQAAGESLVCAKVRNDTQP